MFSPPEIEQRIRQLLSEYAHYRFTPQMDTIAKTFLDLALEYDQLRDFYSMTVLIPKVVMGWDASLYIAENDAEAVLEASTIAELTSRKENGEHISIRLASETLYTDREYLIPLTHADPFILKNLEGNTGPTVGVLGVRPDRDLDEREVFFLAKYADMVCLSVVHRLVARKNEQHINFIQKLVADIGHNVIVPNIFFKAYLRRLAGKINRLKEVQNQLETLPEVPPQSLPSALRDLSAEMANANEGLLEEFDHIEKHYINTSLFLETLLRQSHFEKGYYVLKKTTCNFRRDIIKPQVDRLRPRLREKGINIDLSAGGVPDKTIEAVVDIGLISQVFANLMSNAIKYTRPIFSNGQEKKFIAYGLEPVSGAFGPNADGVKINLFSTGRPMGRIGRGADLPGRLSGHEYRAGTRNRPRPAFRQAGSRTTRRPRRVRSHGMGQ